jgi:ABC-2 type transport system ATP-binding protein
MAGGASRVRVRTPQAAELTRVLASRGISSQPLTADQVIADEVGCELVGQIAAEAGVVVYEMSAERRGLEDAFLALTGDEETA